MVEVQQPKVVLGVLILKDGKALVSLRKSAPGAGDYQFPGRALEHQESFAECARRETKEECGLEIDNLRFAYVANVKRYAPEHHIIVGVTADWAGGEPMHKEPEKSGPWEWHALDELPAPLLLSCELHVLSERKGIKYFDDVP